MNPIKQFKTNLIVLGLFLIFMPTFCHADMAIGFFWFPPAIFLFAFFGVWAIESLVIKDRLEENPKRALLISLVINLFSTFLGYLMLRFEKGHSFLSVIGISFIATMIIEGVILFAIYQKRGWKRIFSASLFMNFLSYLFLGGSLIIVSFPIFGTIFGFLVIIYLIQRLFGLFKTTTELPSGEKISIKTSSSAKYLILVLLIILLAFGLYIDLRPSPLRLKAKDARIQADISQVVSVAETIKDSSGSYEALCDGNKLCTNQANCPKNDYIKELTAIDQDLKAQIPSKKSYNCFVSADTYCVSAALNEKGYYCVDSKGFRGKTNNHCTSAYRCP